MGKFKSSFSGYIAEIPSISVDNFENKHKPAYFLSHYHGDHIIGLRDADFPEKLNKNNGVIYASEVTIAIIKNDYPELTPYLKILDLGTNIVTIKENDEDIHLTVITLPAGHSLGSIMFLFKHKHTVLYSGDFRITPNTVSKYTHLHNAGEPIQIDVLYIDTTFQSVPSFPKRSDVMRNVITHVCNWLKKNETHKVLFVTSAGYGYEYACNEVYNVTNIKTFISEKKWNVFSQFPRELYGITNDSTSRIHMCTKYDNVSTTKDTLTIYFSAMKWCKGNTEDDYIQIISKNKMAVCFSLHCDRSELVYFVNYFQPRKVVGFPDDYLGSRPCSGTIETPFEVKLLSNRKRLILNNNSVVNKRICKDVSQKLFEW